MSYRAGISNTAGISYCRSSASTRTSRYFFINIAKPCLYSCLYTTRNESFNRVSSTYCGTCSSAGTGKFDSDPEKDARPPDSESERQRAPRRESITPSL